MSELRVNGSSNKFSIYGTEFIHSVAKCQDLCWTHKCAANRWRKATEYYNLFAFKTTRDVK